MMRTTKWWLAGGCAVIAAACMALVMLVVLAVQAVLDNDQRNRELLFACSDEAAAASGGGSGGGDAVEASGLAEDEIPGDYLEHYQDTADAWGIDWRVLAAVGWQETRHGSDPNSQTENSAGALGPMQFIPVAWKDHGLSPGEKDGEPPPLDERLDPETAIWSAAHKLSEQGLADGNTRQALVRYYGADVDGYADSVLSKASAYGDGEFEVAAPDNGGGDGGALEDIDCGTGGGRGYAGAAPEYEVGDLSGQTQREPCDAPGAPFSSGAITPLMCAAHKTIIAEFGDRLNPDFSGNCYRSAEDGGEHPRGRACDYMTSVGTMPTPEMEQLGDDIAAYAKENAKTLGTEYIIWKQRIWSVARADEGWRTMPDRGSITQNHHDHVHLSVIE